MTPRFRRFQGWLAALVTLTLAAELLAQTPGQKKYQEGVQAWDSGDYPTVVERMREAIREGPTEGSFRVRNQYDEAYLPHLYLGLALEKLGRLAEARDELRISESQGRVKESNLISLRERALARIAVRLIPPTSTPAPPTPTSPPALPTAAPALEPARLPVIPPTATRPPVVPTLSVAAARPTVPARPTPSGSRALLEEGVRSYFKGEYAQAADYLSRPEVSREGLGKLFLAYALASRVALGQLPESELPRARALRGEAVQAGATTAPEARFISPRVLSLLAASGQNR